LLTPTLQLRAEPRIFFAGQISGVEGYVESIATGLVAGRHAAELARSEQTRAFPRPTAIGSLCTYVSAADPRDYQPANITFDLLPTLDGATRQRMRHEKRARHAEVCRRALESLDQYRRVYSRRRRAHRRAHRRTAAPQRVRAYNSQLCFGSRPVQSLLRYRM